ncbi:site-specific DNA-methyltransferase [Sulfurimonas sp.]|uniref:site-specific DNA-methyltransferase n=1 Tax=Sulfurimonas sp. TaxID=2022749 RepID=UPI00261C7414|nr:site-specific DNA-methyltransferase [Sulfurimonas sp.]MCW8895010.1 site-specific DNA-methyltransferase [Sulfurimonas sp.]
MKQKENVMDEQSINDINYELLKKQFPHAVSIDEEGKYIIDPQKLQMSLDPSKADIKEDGYGLNWVGKKEAYHTAFSKNYKVLKPLNDDNSRNWDTTDNILIKGDNLDALKILRQNYFEAIKMIYIDPPYNTKNDGFVYNDDFTSNTEETLEELGYDKEYVDYIENIQGAKTHSGWLSFMYPRLLLASDLLKDDGVIFISCDDNEVSELKLLCNEIFGEENFIEQLVWKRRSTPPNDRVIGKNHEYILSYAKNIENIKIFLQKRSDKLNSRYANPDNDPRGLWVASDLSANGKGGRLAESCLFDIVNPTTKDSYSPPQNKCWLYNEEKVIKLITDGQIGFRKSTGTPFLKRYLSEVRQGSTLATILDNHGFSQDSAKELRDLFQNDFFDFPKPLKLIKTLLITALSKDDIVLDFFSGSGTTAHAVMDLNAQDNGSRKFIAVQWAEETPEKSEAKKAGYDTVFDITQERIKRAGDKIAKGDIGFRTFEIVEDVKQKIYQKSLEDVDQKDLLAFTQSIVESTEDILFNLIVAESLPLSCKIESLVEDKLYKVDNVAFVLGDLTIDELISKLKSKKELEYITVYSPNISDDKFTLELESAVSSIGIKSDKLRFRG